MIASDKRHAPAAERNGDAILAVLRDCLPPTGTVLEIASGTGQHALHMARNLPELLWQPSDCDPSALRSIAAWREEGPENLLEGIRVDVLERPWPIASSGAIVCINMIHIAPWEACGALFAGAQSRLSSGDPLYLYGPYSVDGKHTAPSNLAFDRSLRSRDPRWGVRDTRDVGAIAQRHDFALDHITPMPANNLSLVFRRV